MRRDLLLTMSLISSITLIALVVHADQKQDGLSGFPVACTGNISGALYKCNAPYTDTTGRIPRDPAIDPSARNLVLIIAGQSNREAEAPTAYVPVNASKIDNFNVYDGKLYAYQDPPLGSSFIGDANGGGPGSLGGRLADKFISGGEFDRVVVAPIAIGGTDVAYWATGPASDRICITMQRLNQRGLAAQKNITVAIEWGQGESDNGGSASAYKALLSSVIDKAQKCGFSGRFFVAKETWINGVIDQTLEAAQSDVVDNETVFPSGDIDSLDATNRLTDNTHLNDAGIASAATLIYNAMRASGAPF